MALHRAAVLAFAAALLPACGGGGGSDGGAPPPPPPTVLFTDDFSSGTLSNWVTSAGVVAAGTLGNPAPCMLVGEPGYAEMEAMTVASFDFSQGLTIEWDSYNGGGTGGRNHRGGLSTSSTLVGIAGNPLAAGIVINTEAGDLQCMLNGTVDLWVNTSIAINQWRRLRVRILPNQTVEYYINGVLIHSSTAVVTVPTPRPIVHQSTYPDLRIDNVSVTVP